MSKRVQIALLGMAAIASLAFAGTRIGDAARGSSEKMLLTPVNGTTAAAEAATLAAVHVPPGFRREHRCSAGVCFVRGKLLPLEVATVRRLVKDVGVELAYRAGRPAVECGVLAGLACKSEGTIGAEEVLVWVERPEVPTHERRTRHNRRTFRAFRLLSATEVEVVVIGHCLHPTECKELEREEASEAPHRLAARPPSGPSR